MNRIVIIALCLWTSATSQEITLQFTEEPLSSIVRNGDRLRLRCKSNSPTEEITWYFNDVKLTSQSSDESNSRRQRRKRNKEDRTSSTSYIDPDFDVRSPSITLPSIPWQSNLVRSSQLQKVHKRKDHRRRGRRRSRKTEDYLTSLKTAKRYVRSVTEEEAINENGIQVRPGRLSIQNFVEKNAGTYHCVVTTPGGSIRSRSALVQVAEISDFAFTTPQMMMIQPGHVAVIPCQLPASVPVAQARWKINNVTRIEEDTDNYIILPSGALLVKNVTSQSSFQCNAYNHITEETKTALTSNVLKIEGSNESKIRENNSETQASIVHPRSFEVLNVSVSVGNQILLECISSDLSTLAWKRNTQDLPSTAQITKEGLLLPSASLSDSGLYACQVSGRPVSVTYHLTVSDAPKVTANPIVITDEGKETVLECTTHISTSLKWTWYYNGALIENEQSNILNISSEGELGNRFYQCFAENNEGSDYAILRVNDTKLTDPLPTYSSTDEYFTATLDKNGLNPPKITSPGRTNKPKSYELIWMIEKDAQDIKLFSIKYYKSPTYKDGVPVSYDWEVVNIPADRRSIVLNNLLPESTYNLEMVTVNTEGGRSQIEISSFDTGKAVDPIAANNLPASEPSKPPEREKSKTRNKNNPGTNGTGKGKKTKNDRSKVPKAPSRPTVTPISANSVSLMWNTRGNGGSPIQGYRIQSRKVDTRESWMTMVQFVTTEFPPYELNGLERGAAYRFRVIAINAAGESSPSSASPSYPKKAIKDPALIDPPFIVDTTTQGETDIVITWQYRGVPISFIGGYLVFYRSSDSDDERDYVESRVNDPTATSYVIRHLQPEMQYDIKIRAFNSQGRSPFSNVMIIETPKPGDGQVLVIDNGRHKPPVTDHNVVIGPDHNDPARERAYQRNTMFLITGAVIGLVLIVLLITVFCYWRRKGENAQNSPSLKQRNGHVTGCSKGKESNQMNMTKLNSNGNHGNNDMSSNTPNSYSQSPHDTRCQCSRHHSNRSSLERRGGGDYCQYGMPRYNGADPMQYPDPDGNWPPGTCPNIHTNPMHMYMDHRLPYYPHGRGMAVAGGPPLWWVRKAGEFCHIVPGDARKMSGGEVTPEMYGTHPGGGGPMVRTYAGNVTNGNHFYDDTMHRPPDNGYHSNEDGLRTSSDSQVGKSDEISPHPSNRSSGSEKDLTPISGAKNSQPLTSSRENVSGNEGNSKTVQSNEDKPPPDASDVIEEENNVIVDENDVTDDENDVTEDTPFQLEDNTSENCDIVDENTNFLRKTSESRKETLIT